MRLGYYGSMENLRYALIVLTALAFAALAVACSRDADTETAPQLSTFTGEAVEEATPPPEAADETAPFFIRGIPSNPYIAQSAPGTGESSAGHPPPGSLASLPSISTLVHEIEPAVASISVESISRGMFFDFADEGAGTGVVIRSDGYIVTNFHVIQGANDIKVNLPSGKTYDARVVGRDIITDLAVLKIDEDNLTTIRMGDSDDIHVGDWVVALGNALALKGGPTVTLGIVSARGRTLSTERGDLYDLIQTDAAINDGNSGGPLINLQGEVIGINTAIIRRAQGIGFAISSTAAQPIINSLIEHGRVVRPLIGLTGADVTPARANQLGLNVDEGIIVTRMTLDGPAYEGGIRVGDVITKLNDIPTPDMAEFLTLLWTFEIGQEVQVEYVHEGETQVTGVTLVERPSL